MALFKVDDILNDVPESVVIELDFFVLPEGVDAPTLTIEVSDKIRVLAQEAADKYNNVKIKYHANSPEGIIINKPVQYCHDVLNSCYSDCTGLIDTPSKKAVLALLKKEPQFSKKLAGKLMDAFNHDDLYTDDKKNSEDS